MRSSTSSRLRHFFFDEDESSTPMNKSYGALALFFLLRVVALEGLYIIPSEAFFFFFVKIKVQP